MQKMYPVSRLTSLSEIEFSTNNKQQTTNNWLLCFHLNVVDRSRVKFCFESKAWKETIHSHIELTEVFRQVRHIGTFFLSSKLKTYESSKIFIFQVVKHFLSNWSFSFWSVIKSSLHSWMKFDMEFVLRVQRIPFQNVWVVYFIQRINFESNQHDFSHSIKMLVCVSLHLYLFNSNIQHNKLKWCVW
jgi:hypothetical protein